MPQTNAEWFQSRMAKTVTRNLLKYAAGRIMFCPVCDDILDCRRIVSVEATNPQGQKATKYVCSDCYDKSNVVQKLKDMGCTQIEVIDGREVFKR